MFGRKKQSNPVEKPRDPQVSIQTIPDVFYGGKDPQIYDTHIGSQEETSSKKELTTEPKKKPPRSMVSSPSQKTSTGLFSNKWFVGGMVGLVLIGGVGITWYYVADYMRAQDRLAQQNIPSQTDRQQDRDVTVVTTTSDIATTTDIIASVTSTVTSTLDRIEQFIEFPPLLTLDTADIDADNLTDIEEELFNTDSGTWDSDDDGYYDGQEVYNLYNPRGFAPVKIIDSGLVKEYINPSIGYRVYYPMSWQQGAVDVRERQVLFSSIFGDYVEIRIIDKDSDGQSFVSWFGRYAEGQRFTDLNEFTNRFRFDGYTRRDSLVAYFHDDQHVVVMVYQPRDRGPIAYRHVMQMMYQSFRMQPTNVDIPDQELFPGVTTTKDIENNLDENTTTSTEVTNESSTTTDVITPPADVIDNLI